MKNIGNYIQESQMFEAEKENLKLSKEDQKQLQEILQRAITAFYNDDEDRDIEDFIKDTFADYGWSDKLMSGFIDMCKQIVDKSDKILSKTDKTNEAFEYDDLGFVFEKTKEQKQIARDAAIAQGKEIAPEDRTLGDWWELGKDKAKKGAEAVGKEVQKQYNNIQNNKKAKEAADKAEEERNREILKHVASDGRIYQDLEDGTYYSSKKELEEGIKKRKDKEWQEEWNNSQKRASDIIKNNQDTHRVEVKPGQYKNLSGKEWDEYLKEHPRQAARVKKQEEEHKYTLPGRKFVKGNDRYYSEKDGEEEHTHIQNHYETSTPWCNFLKNGGPEKVALGAAIVGTVALTTAVAVHTARKQNEKFLAGLKARSEQADDPRIRKEYEKHYQDALKAMYKDNGKVRIDPDFSKIPEESRKSFIKIYDSGKDLRKMGKEYIKKNGSEFLEYDRDHTASSTKKEPKEQVVKAKDGSEIHARRKKSGHGMTYVRTKNGKEVGYATKDDFRRARQNEGMISLKDALLESFEI